MSVKSDMFCLDANVLIQAWQRYYNPKFCSDYWNVLIELGTQDIIFIPEIVYQEITRTEDDLADWLKGSKIPIRKITEPVTICLQNIFSKIPLHKNLVDSTKARSIADPWIIAHAMYEGATVVTKEEKVTAVSSHKVKIPNVCENMGVQWINDFKMIEELGIKFNCSRS
jgi:predicted nucleic acid-binding protein